MTSFDEYLRYNNAEWDQMLRHRAAVDRHWPSIRRKLSPDDIGKWVAFNLLDREYALHENERDAIELLKARNPSAILASRRFHGHQSS